MLDDCWRHHTARGQRRNELDTQTGLPREEEVERLRVAHFDEMVGHTTPYDDRRAAPLDRAKPAPVLAPPPVDGRRPLGGL
ncbi:MAG: hypothetical protein CMH83_13200 [Nocardioides sp.]|nr:hypothetical protein [Nocardioides sp.]